MGRLVVLSLLVVAFVAACGGGGGGQLSHDEFVKQANAICADSNGQIRALGTPTSFDTLVTYAQKARSIVKDNVGKFKQLNPPGEDRDNWQRFGELGDEVVDALGELEDAAKNQDQGEIAKLLARAKVRNAESKRVATAMGTDECAKM